MTTYTLEQRLHHLSVLADERRKVNQAIDQLVLTLRSPDLLGRCDASWQEVADALGVSRQAAWRAYRAVD